ncbi:MAG: alpha/beta fold hydrolase, partial [Bacteroidota bacterium]|nr:alpha/beta fold hydrolase [Bacteroidota bacterium]
MKNKFRIAGWVKLCIIGYSLIGIGIFYLQETIIFQPTVVAADSSYGFKQPYLEKNIALDEQTRFNLIEFTVPDSLRKGVVLYFHGNKGNVKRYNRFVDNFTRHGYEVWMADYPGFGKSTGKVSESILFEESLQVYKLARIQYQPGQIILYGKSLGSGIAAQLASVRDCKRLILETPYYSLTSLAR